MNMRISVPPKVKKPVIQDWHLLLACIVLATFCGWHMMRIALG